MTDTSLNDDDQHDMVMNDATDLSIFLFLDFVRVKIHCAKSASLEDFYEKAGIVDEVAMFHRLLPNFAKLFENFVLDSIEEMARLKAERLLQMVEVLAKRQRELMEGQEEGGHAP